ncbi:TniB family NTP-binding protein [Thiomonas sp. FB-Cd]|uniref:TniB family NTP-binding protein n=1 Tax=Thiomonas sp. FB-Cd TaxID=1158292 RepID=UPI0004DEFD9F|nr:TniB family NTP-binding protein [Thiomonas sp. FB-Cd]
MTASDDGDYAHLSAKTRSALSLSDVERIRFIRAGTWITLDYVKNVLEQLEDLRTHPRVARMPCMLLVGAPFSGKTSLLQHFRDLHPPDLDPESQTTTCEVLMIEAPPKPDISDFYSSILDALMAPYKPTAPAHEKRSQVKRLFAHVGVKVLIVDEIHHLIAGSLNRQREFRNALKSLGNETKVSIVAAGIEEAYNAFNADAQMSSRFKPYDLPRWSIGPKLGVLLKTLESRTPLKRASGLHSPGMMTAIHARSESSLGDICDLVKEAGVKAIRTGEERITLALLDELNWVAPSKRKGHQRFTA